MGVHGLIPFLRKSCPEAIKPLANRFQDIAGKRIAIDGTLVTQRLHFAPSPHPYRHVLGWYRICQELDEHGISAVCIFDGKKRHAAKSRELQRRRTDRQQAADRGHVEQERTRRLEFVTHFVKDLPIISEQERVEVSKVLESFKVAEDTNFEKAYDTLCSQASPSALEELAEAEKEVLTPVASSKRIEPAPMLSEKIKSIFDNFRTSVTYLASSVQPYPPAKDTAYEEQPEPDLVLTKAQSQLSVMERKLWIKLSAITPMTVQDDQVLYQEVSSLATALLTQSHKMSDSFQRRTNLPTADTYNESRAILTAMGVRCIEAPGETEGEALASSIVLHGDADFVVSEDTDVLVYGAPLLRNISTSGDPLEIICAQTIQRCLGLDSHSYLDFILLLGTDFSQRIKNVGPQRALQFIKQHGSIESILKAQTKYTPPLSLEEYLKEVEAARALFTRIPENPVGGEMDAVMKDNLAITNVLTRYRLGRYLMNSPYYEYEDRLAGNFFGDNPYAS